VSVLGKKKVLMPIAEEIRFFDAEDTVPSLGKAPRVLEHVDSPSGGDRASVNRNIQKLIGHSRST
jgi:hypothetical protein